MMVKHFNRMPVRRKLGLFLSAMTWVALGLAACSGSATPQPVAASPTAVPATATQAPTATATQAPTATATEVPTATATQPPTATAVPPLALVQDGFKAWCAPTSYAGALPTSPDAPSDARLLTVKDNQMQVQIPAAYCVVTFQFNQAAPSGLRVVFYDANNPFMTLPLNPVSDHPDEVWAVVKHDYVINPPFWWVTYTLKLTGADGKELWTNPLKFAKALPPTCIYTNELPDPVTGWCPISDPWEIEPHPDAKYPYDRSRLLTPQPK